ncbi:hypothetical protein ACGFZS_47300 [Streptomyces sp. NPDC048288]|uniref:hypothetical protein n=1 Tax=Streptomyces sp. NPDC048288 TaxID=3365529 RepID=UPI0037133C02
MLATPERTRDDHDRPIQLWHLLGDGHVCNGECDFHPIACSNTEGITLPAGTRDVPVDLDEPGQRWCGDCLVIAQK